MGHTKEAGGQIQPMGYGLLIPMLVSVPQSVFFVRPTGVSWGKVPWWNRHGMLAGVSFCFPTVGLLQNLHADSHWQSQKGMTNSLIKFQGPTSILNTSDV